MWQAVRPAGKALSVHQGKGATALAARTGALCEAIESHCAENAPADGPFCAYADLDPAERAADPSDYAHTRSAAPAPGPVQWCIAEDLLSGRRCHLPHDIVSLDFTERGSTWFDRSSAGLGLGATADEATATSLLEIVERDAVGEWQRLPAAERFAAPVDTATVRFGWFLAWRDRLAALGIDIVLFAPEAVVPVPVLVCWIGAQEEYGERYRSFSGSACHPDPERALFKAFAEAAQSRLTLIAGVRDDILPSHYAARDAALPRLSGRAGRGFDSVQPYDGGWRRVAAALGERGYRQVAVKRLDPGLEGVAVTKVFVPGLGSLKRGRRAP